ncbi:MAG: DUF2784 domain-containing protein [Pseudomonadota bacterium]
MEASTQLLLAADLILLVHVLFVLFVVLGLTLVLLGRMVSWGWVRNPWFRLTHLAAIVVVVLQSWFGAICPLTIWENALRAKAGGAVYSGTFISHWLQTLLYYDAPPWIFAVCYTVFGLLVVASWFWVRPRRFGAKRPRNPSDAQGR